MCTVGLFLEIQSCKWPRYPLTVANEQTVAHAKNGIAFGKGKLLTHWEDRERNLRAERHASDSLGWNGVHWLQRDAREVLGWLEHCVHNFIQKLIYMVNRLCFVYRLHLHKVWGLGKAFRIQSFLAVFTLDLLMEITVMHYLALQAAVLSSCFLWTVPDSSVQSLC